MSNYDTYAYLPTGDTAGYQVAFDESVIREVNQEMQARGYRLNTENPDLLVLVKSMYQEETVVERSPIYTTYDYYNPDILAPESLERFYYTRYNTVINLRGANIRTIEYSEGGFLVDMIDASNNEIVWRGWSPTSVNPLALQSSIRSYIDNIFEEFPVPAKE